jgi:hypothetical protein
MVNIFYLKLVQSLKQLGLILNCSQLWRQFHCSDPNNYPSTITVTAPQGVLPLHENLGHI